jgi:hypothetical protein
MNPCEPMNKCVVLSLDGILSDPDPRDPGKRQRQTARLHGFRCLARKTSIAP